MKLLLLVFCVLVVLAGAFRMTPSAHRRSSVRALGMCEGEDRAARRAARAAKLEDKKTAVDPKKVNVGVDIPPEILQMKEPIYDMILVERVSAPTKSESGIILPPGPDGKDMRSLGMVLKMPEEGVHGLESEGGRVQPVSELCAGLKVGDYVYLMDGWGIGPKNIEIGERKFSFHKFEKIRAVIR